MPTIKGKLRKKSKKKKEDHRGTSYKPEYDLAVYKVLSKGGTKKEAAAVLGVDVKTLSAWTKQHVSFKKAIQEAKQSETKLTLSDYIVGRLDPAVLALWEQLKECEDDEHMTMTVFDAMTEEDGKRMRQYLFIHAWVSSCFSITKALKRINITKTIFDKWCREWQFKKMVQEIHWHKKNFMEEALMGCVARGETSAIIFANKTINRDRGYQEKIELEMGDTINPAMVAVADLNLTLEEKRTALKSIRDKREQLKKIDGEVLA